MTPSENHTDKVGINWETKLYHGYQLPSFPGPFESCGRRLSGDRLLKAEENWWQSALEGGVQSKLLYSGASPTLARVLRRVA